MTDPLFAALPGPHGAVRKQLDAELAKLGADLPGDLVLVVQSLADQVDSRYTAWLLNPNRSSNGFAMLADTYFRLRRDLVTSVDAGDADDGLAAALADFRAAAAGHPTAAGPEH